MTRPEEHPASTSQDTADRRAAERRPFGGEVTVSFRDLELVGPGRNISTTGVYFVAAARPIVHVAIEGRDEPVPAELIRFETLADGQVGVAVRFLEPL
jgi:hypothetical protein